MMTKHAVGSSQLHNTMACHVARSETPPGILPSRWPRTSSIKVWQPALIPGLPSVWSLAVVRVKASGWAPSAL